MRRLQLHSCLCTGCRAASPDPEGPDEAARGGGSGGGGDAGFKPAGLSLDAAGTGRVLVSDCARGRVLVLGAAGGGVERCLLSAVDGVRTPRSLALDKQGLLVVVDLSSFRLYQLENMPSYL